jgi:XTP/dITP diphosphohydrolase
VRLLFATQNNHKRDEVQAILGDAIHIISLKELNFSEELPETHFTLEENALEKAEFIYKKFAVDCFSEDAGLEIAALNGEPGVFSAGYAGPGRSSKDNINLVLEKMRGTENRNASFRAVICLILKSKPYYFHGVVKGTIIKEVRGVSGFGYDPIFMPEGFSRTFAEMTAIEKNAISHRRMAIEAMHRFLSGTYGR